MPAFRNSNYQRLLLSIVLEAADRGEELTLHEFRDEAVRRSGREKTIQAIQSSIKVLKSRGYLDTEVNPGFDTKVKPTLDAYSLIRG